MATTSDPLAGQPPNVSVQKGSKVLTPPTRTRRPTTPAEQETDTVQVWPHLVVIEFLAAVIITINLVLLGTLFNGPLAGLANPDQTPNPSKAPWYFLNLQELLLHMNPALAGVIVPTIALVFIAVIPYVDRGTKGLGVWFYNERGPKIAIFSAIYTALVTAALIGLDTATGTIKAVMTNALYTTVTSPTKTPGSLSWLTEWVGANIIGGPSDNAQATAQGLLVEALAGWTIPSIFLIGFPILLVILLKLTFKKITLTEIIIGLFTGFVTVYVVLTFVGTFMRGHGLVLQAPWDCQCTANPNP